MKPHPGHQPLGGVGEAEEAGGCRRIYTAAGEHNLVADLGFDDIEEMRDRITKDIHEIPGIKRTETLSGFTEYTNGPGL